MSKQSSILEAEMRVKKWFGKEQSFKEAREAAIALNLGIQREYNKGDYFFRQALYPKMKEAEQLVLQYNSDYEDLKLLGRI